MDLSVISYINPFVDEGTIILRCVIATQVPGTTNRLGTSTDEDFSLPGTCRRNGTPLIGWLDGRHPSTTAIYPPPPHKKSGPESCG